MDDQENGDHVKRLNLSQLAIALSLNRPDVANQKVFLDDVQWDMEDLFPFIMDALINNKTRFLELFLSKSFDFGEFLTFQRLEDLYTNTINCLGDTSNSELKRILVAVNKKVPKKLTLDLLGRVIRRLTGGQFKPTYLKPKFINKYTKYVDPMSANKTTEKAALNSQSEGSEEASSCDHEVENQEEEFEEKSEDLNCFDDAYMELFIWAILTKRFETAKLFWTVEKEAMPCALMGAMFLRKMTVFATSDRQKEELRAEASKYEERAVGVLDECEANNVTMARECLIREQTLFGERSTIELAAEGESIIFLAHGQCQDYLTIAWNNTMDPRRTMLETALSLFFGLIFCPFLIPYSMSFREEIYDTAVDELRNVFLFAPLAQTQRDDGQNIIVKRGERTYKQAMRVGIQKIRDFYFAPATRFYYTLVSRYCLKLFYLAFLEYFTYVIMFTMKADDTTISIYVAFLFLWVISLLLEEVRQLFLSGITISDYLNDLWNALDLLGLSLFFFGFLMYTLVLYDSDADHLLMYVLNSTPITSQRESLIRLSRISWGLSLFIYFIRLMQFFAISRTLGPMIIMIQRMVVKDLIPFITVYMVTTLGFSVLQWVVSFVPTKSTDDSLNFRTLFYALRYAFFQIFGDYNFEFFQQVSDSLIDPCLDKCYAYEKQRERQLMQWERLRALDYQRKVLYAQQGMTSSDKRIVVRTTSVEMTPIPSGNINPQAGTFGQNMQSNENRESSQKLEIRNSQSFKLIQFSGRNTPEFGLLFFTDLSE
ncbi:Transient receptor putative cation channel subfamily M member 2 [Cichlidogyrus casuarinus]|uniref:Transient receptor putative cation channel subfamily M member 2 n=1 Tax=Cichlidogyrus casuarinus TaxID=1844966 RepID=A0ABD2Q1Y5_9PLAT